MDSGAGVEVLVKMGDEVEKGEPVARLYDGWSTEEGRDAGAGGPEGPGRARRARPWYPGQPVKNWSTSRHAALKVACQPVM